MTIQELQRQLADEKRGIDAMLQRQMAQAKDEGRERTDAEKRQLDERLERAKSLKHRIEQAQGDENFMAALSSIPGASVRSDAARSRYDNPMSLGAQFVNSATYAWLREHRGKLPQGAWTSTSSELMAATLTEDAASGGDLVITDYQRAILPMPTRVLVIADLMSQTTTESNAVGYMKEVTATNAAAPTAEGAAKPESTLAFDAVTDPVRKIATWLPVTEEILEDVPSIRGYIDTRLQHFVQLAEDDQLLNGNGTAPNISGILDRAGIAAPIARTTETNPDVIAKQIAAIESATLLTVDGIVMHPNNWNSILLLKDADGNYIAGGGPFSNPTRKTLWGRNVAVTPAITANTALVGAFKQGAQIFRKGGLRVEASNAHASFFIENKVAIRAEERLALACYRESAFGLVTNLTSI